MPIFGINQSQSPYPSRGPQEPSGPVGKSFEPKPFDNIKKFIETMSTQSLTDITIALKIGGELTKFLASEESMSLTPVQRKTLEGLKEEWFNAIQSGSDLKVKEIFNAIKEFVDSL